MDPAHDHPSSTGKRLASRPFFWAALVLCLLVYVTAALPIAATKAVISPDCGARLLQVQALHEHWPQWWIPYPARALDPLHQNSPLGFYEFVHGGKTYTFYSFTFALLSAVLSGALGYFGLLVLPMLSGIVTGVLTYALAVRVRLRHPVVPMLLVTLLSPLLLYGVVFWDTAVTTAVATACFYMALRAAETGRTALWLVVGLLLGAGLWVHEIVVGCVPALAVGAIWLYRRKCLAPIALLVLGIAALTVPLAIINHAVYGTYAGPHLQNNRLGTPSEAARLLLNPTLWGPAAYYTLFGWGDSNPAYSWQLHDWLQFRPQTQLEFQSSALMSVPVVLWLVMALTGAWRRPKMWAVALLFFLGIVADGVWVMTHRDLAHSLFYVCPFLALAFAARLPRTGQAAPDGPSAPPESRRWWVFLALAAAVFSLVELLLPTLGGTEWGARNLLIPVPILVLFACLTLEDWSADWKARRGAAGSPAPSAMLLGGAGALLALTVLLQANGYSRFLSMHRWNQQLTRDLLATPERVVITTSWWAPLNAAPAYPHKQLLYAGDPEHPATPLFLRMRMANIPSYLLLGESPKYLSDFSGPLGYSADPASVRPTAYGLWLCRYTLHPEAELGSPAPEPSGGEIPPAIQLPRRAR